MINVLFSLPDWKARKWQGKKILWGRFPEDGSAFLFSHPAYTFCRISYSGFTDKHVLSWKKCRHRDRKRHQNLGEILYLYNVVTPSPSTFAFEFHPWVSHHILREHELDWHGSFSYPMHQSQIEKIVWGIWRPKEVISLNNWSFKQDFQRELLSSYLHETKCSDPPPTPAYL